MSVIHKDLAAGRWAKLSFFEQMANVGSEIERTIKWKHKGNDKYSQMAFERAFELLDLTISSAKTYSRLKELVRVREVLADHFIFKNTYGSTEQSWKNYFFSFTNAAQIQRNR